MANLAVRYAARAEPPSSGQQWLLEDDLLDAYQTRKTREQDPVERSLSKQFYVDDYLGSAHTERSGLGMLTEGIGRFRRCQFKLCKVQSNSPMIREAFSDGTASKTVVDLSPVDLSAASTEKPNTALGLQWNLVTDTLCVKTESKFRPMTRRGLLSYIMSPYDPFGIAAPAMLSSKLFQREIIPPQDSDPHHFNKLG